MRITSPSLPPLLLLAATLSGTTAQSLGFTNPTLSSGSWLTAARNTFPAGLGEPINLVVSSASDRRILTQDGFRDWSAAIDFSGECLGQSGGFPQAANLGGTNGLVDQTGVMRYNYNDPVLGTCKQSLLGGNHFRYWQQLPSRAYFLAASFEQNLTLNHMIERPDGYDHGRDSIVANATRSGGARSPLSSVVYDTTVEMVSGEGYLTPNSSRGVNHGIVTDGRVAVLTVTVREGTTATTGAIAAPPASTGLRNKVAGLFTSIGLIAGVLLTL